jgi:putative tricarboxylic transport membrane protein
VADLFAKLVKSAHWKRILNDRGWLDLHLPEQPYQAFIADETHQARRS